MLGQKLPIKSNKDYDLSENKFFIIKEFITKGHYLWLFDEYGNPIYKSKTKLGDLPLDYQKEGELYIKIKNFSINQDNLDLADCYQFFIYMYGHQESCTNNFAYTDIRDCLDKAIELIKEYKQDFKNYFKNLIEIEISPSGVIINQDGTINSNL